jgi:sulfatase maturation enzyme AslB (radical SAM superfamily)
MKTSAIDDIVAFMDKVVESGQKLKYVCFHGGEPMLYVKKMDHILDKIYPHLVRLGCKFIMTTNGSLIAENAWFFEKWKGMCQITFSYDFNFQEVNRSAVDIDAVAKVLHSTNTGCLFQFVVPLDKPDAMGIETVAAILDACKRMKCNVINLIPLRHLRGAQKFKVILDEINLDHFMMGFMRMLHTLYVQGMKVYIDGNYGEIDKHYLDNHGKVILSPDGYLYPEFDFLEYKRDEFRVGKWRNGIELYRQGNEDDKILPGCRTCPTRPICGLKYLHKMFGTEPSGNCVKFYKTIDVLVNHMHKLTQKPSMLHWVGIDE